MIFSKDGAERRAEAALAVVGRRLDGRHRRRWTSPIAGVETDAAASCASIAHLRTSAPHVFAAGDVTGRLMLVPQALQDGFVAAPTPCAARRSTMRRAGQPDRQLHRSRVRAGRADRGQGARDARRRRRRPCRFDATTRTIIDGRDDRLLQADRRPRHGDDPRLPRRRRAGRRDRPGGGDRHGRSDACRRTGADSAVVPHLHRHSRSRCCDRRTSITTR